MSDYKEPHNPDFSGAIGGNINKREYEKDLKRIEVLTED